MIGMLAGRFHGGGSLWIRAQLAIASLKVYKAVARQMIYIKEEKCRAALVWITTDIEICKFCVYSYNGICNYNGVMINTLNVNKEALT